MSCSGRSILVVGQLSRPVTGEYVSNCEVVRILKSAGHHVSEVDTRVSDVVSDVGSFSFVKIFRQLAIYFRFVFSVPGVDFVYMTPGQTFFGLMRFVPLLFISRLCSKRVILHWHGYGMFLVLLNKPWMFRVFFNAGINNVVLTEELKSRLCKFGADAERVTVVKNFFTGSIRAPRQLSDGERITVLYLGGLMKEKGIINFLEAAYRLRHINFVVCGSGEPTIEDILLEADSKGVLDFKGTVSGSDKDEVFMSCDVFVLQTDYPTEGVPLTILEALSFGCAVITTYHNGIPETVGNSAIFVKAQSTDDLCESIVNFDSDRKFLEIMKLKAVERAGLYKSEFFESKILSIFS